MPSQYNNDGDAEMRDASVTGDAMATDFDITEGGTLPKDDDLRIRIVGIFMLSSDDIAQDSYNFSYQEIHQLQHPLNLRMRTTPWETPYAIS